MRKGREEGKRRGTLVKMSLVTTAMLYVLRRCLHLHRDEEGKRGREREVAR